MDKIKKALDADVNLQPSSGGVFEVTVDGQLVYSKKKTGRFPVAAELVSSLKG